jgi:serine/threonine protein kinase
MAGHERRQIPWKNDRTEPLVDTFTTNNEHTEIIVSQRVFPLAAGDPTRVAGFALTGRLKRSGGLTQVYLAYRETADGKLDTRFPFVVKALPKDAPRETRQRLEREAACMQRVDSTRVARLVQHSDGELGSYLVQEYVEGEPLGQLMTRGRLSGNDSLLLAIGLLESLQDVHAAGVVHRDVKPMNVIFRNRGVTLVDLGISLHVQDPRLTARHEVWGTLRYMSPEQDLGEDVEPASDVFSWAVTVAEAAGGRHPFDPHGRLANHSAEYRRVLHDQRRRPLLDTVPHYLVPLLAAALARTPQERPSVTDLLTQLRTIHNTRKAEASGGADTSHPIDSTRVAGPDELLASQTPDPIPSTRQACRRIRESAMTLIIDRNLAFIVAVLLAVALSVPSGTLLRGLYFVVSRR